MIGKMDCHALESVNANATVFDDNQSTHILASNQFRKRVGSKQSA